MEKELSTYIRLRKRISIVTGSSVRLNQIAHIWVNDHVVLEQLKQLVIYKHEVQEGNRAVIDLITIISIIKNIYPTIQIEVYGDSQVLIMIQHKAMRPKRFLFVICWLILFFGSGLALMNFHSDVNMKETHSRIVELLTGEKLEHPLWFQIPYSFGVGAGMVIFFNHIFRKKFNEEPNPLEVEMYLYQENINTYVIAEELRKKSDHDAKSSP